MVMKKRRRVILYGTSIILGALGISLERYPDLEVLPLGAPFIPVEELTALNPDVILIDVISAHPGPLWDLLNHCPDLLMIGLNPSNESLLVLSVQPLQALSIANLVDIILQKASISENIKGDRLEKNDLREDRDPSPGKWWGCAGEKNHIIQWRKP
jgi:hypothetical protein